MSRRRCWRQSGMPVARRTRGRGPRRAGWTAGGGVERGARNVSLANIVALARALDVASARLMADVG